MVALIETDNQHSARGGKSILSSKSHKGARHMPQTDRTIMSPWRLCGLLALCVVAAPLASLACWYLQDFYDGRNNVRSWQVVSDTCLHVLLQKQLPSPTLDGQQKCRCDVVHGVQEDRWVKLHGDTGYLQRLKGATELLQELPGFRKVPSGQKCSSRGWFRIVDLDACETAAEALELSFIKVTDVSPGALPDRCFYDAGHAALLWLVDGSSADLPVGGFGEPMCTTTDSTVVASCMTTTMSATPTTLPRTTTLTDTSTMISTTTFGFPSLFCWEFIMAGSAEVDLVKNQYRLGASIFGCDSHLVLSTARVSYGSCSNCRSVAINVDGDVHSVTHAYGKQKGAVHTHSWINVLNFMAAWEQVDRDSRFRNFDWTIKLDADAVMLPNRLRGHLAPHTPKGGFPMSKKTLHFIENCNKFNMEMLYGPLEAFTRDAVEAYLRNVDFCKQQLHWKSMGEDEWVETCLEKVLKVEGILDVPIIGNRDCWGAECDNGQNAAYHPFKNVTAWTNCWNTANR